jgi:hypothetical protein
MSIKFKNVAHMFVYEKHPKNKFNGKVTSHPFACIAIGFDDSIPEVPFRVAATMCHTKDRFNRKIAATKATGLLQSSDDGKHAHAKWYKPSELLNSRSTRLKDAKTILFDLGFTIGLGARFKSKNTVEWKKASEHFDSMFKDVTADVKPKAKVAKA